MKPNYLISVVLILLSVSAVIVGFNWFIDPIGLFYSPRISGVNVVRSEAFAHDRQIKAWGVYSQAPDGIILGTSRASVGLNPEHPGWTARHAYNAAVTASTPYYAYRYFQHANAVAPVRELVLALDFGSFSPSLAGFSTLDESMLKVQKSGNPTPGFLLLTAARTLYSLGVLKYSLNTLLENRSPKYRDQDPATYVPQFSRAGIMQPDTFLVQRWLPFRQRAYGTLSQYVMTLWDEPEDFLLVGEDGGESSGLHWYRMLLREAYANDVQTHLFFNPSHAYILEALAANGLWDIWERWKIEIAAINEAEAARAGKTPFPLLDFSGYNRFTTETIANATGAENAPQFYWDPGHYRQLLGQYVFDTALGGPPAGDPEFGVAVNSTNLPQRLEAIRLARLRYREGNAEEVAELDAALAEMLAQKSLSQIELAGN